MARSASTDAPLVMENSTLVVPSSGKSEDVAPSTRRGLRRLGDDAQYSSFTRPGETTKLASPSAENGTKTPLKSRLIDQGCEEFGEDAVLLKDSTKQAAERSISKCELQDASSGDSFDDEALEAELEELSKKAARMKQLAEEMGKGIEMQNQMLQRLCARDDREGESTEAEAAELNNDADADSEHAHGLISEEQ